jgi:hypothetical protein
LESENILNDVCYILLYNKGPINVKVKFTLEQATKTQKAIRCIALLFP